MMTDLPHESKPGIARREFLQRAGLAAAGAVALGHGARTAALAASRPSNASPADARAAAGGRPSFKLMIDGAPPELLSRIEAIAIDDLAVDLRETTTGLDVEYRTYAPGDAHFGRITLRSRLGANTKDLYQWWQDCAKGTNIRKSISVICLKRDGSELRRFNLLDCFPTRFAPGELDAAGTGLVERLELRIGRIELAAVGEPPKAPGARFEVTIGDPAAGRPGAAAAGEPDRSWESLGGGALVLDVVDPAPGCEAFRTTTPGHKYIDALTLRGPLTAGRRDLCAWINDTVGGKPGQRTLTVREVAKGDTPVRTFNYHDCFPTRYVFPALSADGTGNLYEEVTIKPTRLELA